MSILKSLTESIIKIIQNNNVYINREVLDALIEHRNKSETLIALQEQHLNKIKTELAEKELIIDELRVHMETLEVEIKRLRGISNTEKLPPENRKINLFETSEKIKETQVTENVDEWAGFVPMTFGNGSKCSGLCQSRTQEKPGDCCYCLKYDKDLPYVDRLPECIADYDTNPNEVKP